MLRYSCTLVPEASNDDNDDVLFMVFGTGHQKGRRRSYCMGGSFSPRATESVCSGGQSRRGNRQISDEKGLRCLAHWLIFRRLDLWSSTHSLSAGAEGPALLLAVVQYGAPLLVTLVSLSYILLSSSSTFFHSFAFSLHSHAHVLIKRVPVVRSPASARLSVMLGRSLFKLTFSSSLSTPHHLCGYPLPSSMDHDDL